jgi:TolB-like protein
LSLGGREIRVTPKSLAVLYALARRPHQVVTKAELFAEVWPASVVTDAALSSCVAELRKALGEDARNPRYIETVHRRGFRVLQPCTVADGDPVTADSFSRTQPSIMLLPFENVGGEESSNVIARGLVHDVITRIARARVMFIISRGTTFQFDSGPRDVKRIGEKLGVRYIVQGAVQISGDRLKVSVALANAATREELWSEQYQRRLADFMLMQEEIAELIVASLESEVQRTEVRKAVLMPSSDLDAWSAYHRGIHQMYQFKRDACDEAEQLFRRSIEMEPGVPRPYAGLSFVQFERVFLNIVRDRSAGIEKAFDYALQSVSIDPLDPMGHWALSRAHLLRGELEEAKESLETAIELNPSYAIAQYSLGWVALQLGDNQLCLDRVGFARRLSPYDPLKFAMLGVSALNLALMGRTAEAAALAERSTQQANAHHQALAFAAVTYALDGQIEKARAFFARIRKASPRYGIDDFLAVFPFRRQRDIERVGEAFKELQPRTGLMS